MANGGADASQGEGWWQASDGKWYPPQTASPSIPPPPPPQTPFGRCWYGQCRRQQDSVAGVDAAVVLDVDRHVAAPGAYQDVGGAGSGCSCVGETGPDDNRHPGGDRRRRSFDLQPGGCGLVDEHPVRAGHCPQLGHDGCLKGDPFVESHLHVGGRFEWYCGFDQIELDSPRASLGHIRTERPNRRRWGRYQRLTPVVALRIHRPEVRS